MFNSGGVVVVSVEIDQDILSLQAAELEFSSLGAVELEVRRALSEMNYLGLSLNESKTVNVSKKRRRTLVGLVLSNEGQVSIGRDKKRMLRAAMSNLAKGELSSAETSRLRGVLAFTHGIDPEFVRQLCERYGFATIQDVDAPGDGTQGPLI